MSILKKIKKATRRAAQPGVIELPETLLKKINAHKQAFAQQVQQLQGQTRRDIELLVDGYVSNLDLPENAQLSYNHDTSELTWHSKGTKTETDD